MARSRRCAAGVAPRPAPRLFLPSTPHETTRNLFIAVSHAQSTVTATIIPGARLEVKGAAPRGERVRETPAHAASGRHAVVTGSISRDHPPLGVAAGWAHETHDTFRCSGVRSFVRVCAASRWSTIGSADGNPPVRVPEGRQRICSSRRRQSRRRLLQRTCRCPRAANRRRDWPHRLRSVPPRSAPCRGCHGFS
jgi:hypothetical protein